MLYVLCTKSRSVLCIRMGIHRNEFAANLNLKEHQFFLLTLYNLLSPPGLLQLPARRFRYSSTNRCRESYDAVQNSFLLLLKQLVNDLRHRNDQSVWSPVF